MVVLCPTAATNSSRNQDIISYLTSTSTSAAADTSGVENNKSVDKQKISSVFVLL